jgi:hypothetical protein
MMIYEGRDRVVALLPADTANLALIVLAQIKGDVVAPSQLADRPCIGVALFSNVEWTNLTSRRKPSEVRPSEATLRLRVYPATPTARVAVENIQDRTVYVAEGLEILENPPRRTTHLNGAAPPFNEGLPLKWSVQARLDSARGRCSVE